MSIVLSTQCWSCHQYILVTSLQARCGHCGALYFRERA